MAPRRPALRKPKKGYRKGYKNKISLKKLVKKEINKNNNKMLETKTSCQTQSDGAEMFHNTLILRTSNMFSTTQGTADPESNNINNRIGDKISLVGLSIKIMFELNERYSGATFRILVIRSAKGDFPTQANMFNNLSGNKMLDTFNKDRFTIVAQKTFQIRQSSTGMNQSGIQEVGSGFTSGVPLISRATKIVKLWIPGSAITKNKILTFENGTSQPKFYDYSLVYYAYSNYSTTTSYYVARVNDEVIQLYYKDA